MRWPDAVRLYNPRNKFTIMLISRGGERTKISSWPTTSCLSLSLSLTLLPSPPPDGMENQREGFAQAGFQLLRRAIFLPPLLLPSSPPPTLLPLALFARAGCDYAIREHLYRSSKTRIKRPRKDYKYLICFIMLIDSSDPMGWMEGRGLGGRLLSQLISGRMKRGQSRALTNLDLGNIVSIV